MDEQMTQYEMIKELFDSQIAGIHEKLDGIYEQTKKTNGRVTLAETKIVELEKAEINHINVCPQAPRIKALEVTQAENAATKAFVLKSVTVLGTIMGIVWIVYKMFIEPTG